MLKGMKPRTELEKRVFEEYGKMTAERKDISSRQRKWIEEYAFKDHFTKLSSKHLRCLGCGHMIRADEKVCPICGAKRKVEFFGSATKPFYRWILVADTWKEWQILRVVEVSICVRRTGRYMFMNSIFENWITADGKRTIMGRKKLPMHSSEFDWRTDMTIKHERNQASYYCIEEEYMRYSFVCPYGKVHPEFRKRGFRMTPKESKINLVKMCLKIGKDSVTESMLKLGLKKLVYGRLELDGVPEHCWKLALRYSYNPKDVRMWRDYVSDLEYLNLDTHNPKLLLPDNLEDAHDRMTTRARNKRRKEQEERDREKAREDLEKYLKEKQAYLGIVFSGKGLNFHVLQSPLEFIEEGHEMKHCVARYYSQKDSLIMSCRDDEGKRVETVEVSLKNFTIVQSQGMCNRATSRHDDILKIVRQNMRLIRKANKAQLA